MFSSRSRFQSFALWLALAGVALRSLVPVGFMPGWTGSADEDGKAAWLIICPTSPLYDALASPVATKPHHDHAAMLAAAAASADPHAHHRMNHGAADPAPMVDAHAGHDPGKHNGHLIAAEHLSCPFAGAASPALPAVDTAFLVALSAATTLDSATVSAVIPAERRRRPPARAPPSAIDDTAVA